jgi:hypothetical protein
MCVLLIALWVRSQWWVDGYVGPITANWSFEVGSIPGACALAVISSSEVPTWTNFHQSTDEWWGASKRLRPYSSKVWGLFSNEVGYVTIPFWFLVLLFATFAAIPWFPWCRRFSLRTLLIMMTLVAVALGVAMYYANKAPTTPPFNQGFGR